MDRLFSYIFGFVRIKISHAFVPELLNACQKNGISFLSVKCKNGVLLVEIKKKHIDALVDLSNEQGAELEAINEYGIIHFLSPLKNRFGVCIGLFLSVILISFLSSFVWNVEVVGNERLSQTEILSLLEEQGLKEGTFWKGFDKQACENALMMWDENLAWAHINKIGAVARVELREATPRPEVVESRITNYIADKDGIIVSAIVYDGWQEAKVGDSVAKGDLLISGVYESEAQKKNMFAHAYGRFSARVEEKIDYTVSREQKYRLVVDEKKYKTLCFFGLRLPLYAGRVPKINVQSDIKQSRIYINDFRLPVGIDTNNVTIYKTQTKQLSDKELNQLIEKELKQSLDDSFGKKNILSLDYEIMLNATNARAKGKALVVESIGEEQVIMKNKKK